jgi:hypothetical protein
MVKNKVKTTVEKKMIFKEFSFQDYLEFKREFVKFVNELRKVTLRASIDRE